MKIKNIKKQLKQEVNNIEINDEILKNVKSQCFISEKSQPVKTKSKNYWFYGALPAFVAVVLVVSLSVIFLTKLNTNISDSYVYITMTPNVSTFSNLKEQAPAFELVVNQNNEVVERGLNASGVVILSNNNVNNTLEESLNHIVNQSSELGFLTRYNLNISTTNFDSKSIERQLNETISNQLVLLQNNPRYDFEFLLQNNEITNKYNIHQNLYDLILEVQTKLGGKIEDYLDDEYDDLIDLLYDYNKEKMETFEEEIEKQLDLIEKQYEFEINHLEQIYEDGENFIDKIEELIEYYEDYEFDVDSFKDLFIELIEQLSDFIIKAQTFFENIKVEDLDELLSRNNIENFLNTFESTCNKIEEKLEAVEDEMEEKIIEFKNNLFNF